MSDFQKRIDDGVSGKYEGLDNGLDKVNEFLYGVQRKWYYLFGGLSNTAKTTFVDWVLMNAIRDADMKGIDIHIFYYSYEIDAESKKCVWMSNHIFAKYRIEIPPQKIAGYGSNRLTPEEKEIVDRETPYIDKLFSRINFRYDPNNPTGIYKELMDHFDQHGKFNKEKYKAPAIDKYGNDVYDNEGNRVFEEKERIVSYTHNNPNAYHIVVHDHIALTKIERKYTLKENLDKLSEYYVWLRNICGLTVMAIQQFNQTLNSVERRKFSGVDLTPQQNDFKDSGNPYQDSDTACGIMNPHSLDMPEWKGYRINIKGKDSMKDSFRVFKIIKNRKGKANISFGIYFNPKAGFFKELPHPDKMTDQDYKEIKEGIYY